MCRFVTQDTFKYSFGCKDSNYFVIMQADVFFVNYLLICNIFTTFAAIIPLVVTKHTR